MNKGLLERNNQVPFDKGRIFTPPYSQQYEFISSRGNLTAAPSLGSPTFVWHLGIWQKKTSDEIEPSSNVDGQKTQLDDIYPWHDEHERKFFDEISNILAHLQKYGRRNSEEDETLMFRGVDKLPGTDADDTHIFKTCDPQSLSFLLWWQDEASKDRFNKRQDHPQPEDLRVQVKVYVQQDHITLTFYIDAGKPYNQPQSYVSGQAPGKRRSKIAEYLALIREVGEDQIHSGSVEFPLVPERRISSERAEQLHEAADYFYRGIWQEFRECFNLGLGFSDSAADNLESKCFANFRGVLMSVPGLENTASDERRAQYTQIRNRLGIEQHPPTEKEGRTATTGLGAFEIFDKESGEPNTVIRSLWPFIRRTTPWADYRDFVACGIISWRALFISSLGASGSYYANAESASKESEVPGGQLPDGEVDGPLNLKEPIRYLVLTKKEPHRQQAGRFLERINTVNTLRLFALKNLATIQNAGTHIRVLGRELDGILYQWTQERSEIDEEIRKKLRDTKSQYEDDKGGNKFHSQKKNSLGDLVKRSSKKSLHVRTQEEENIVDEKISRLSQLIYDTESKIIKLGSKLDRIGQKGSGRLLYIANRSKYHSEEFNRLWPTLEINNIDGWINYKQFVERGPKPVFNMIEQTAERLVELRRRLQIVTETIQTSALIIETEATRSNTQTLKNILANLYWLRITGIGLIIIILKLFFENSLGWLTGIFGSALEWFDKIIGIIL